MLSTGQTDPEGRGEANRNRGFFSTTPKRITVAVPIATMTVFARVRYDLKIEYEVN